MKSGQGRKIELGTLWHMVWFRTPSFNGSPPNKCRAPEAANAEYH